MKKYVNGNYVEMTEDEVTEWQEAQKEVQDIGGGMKLIGTYSAEEGSTVFNVPVGKQYTDVVIEFEIKTNDTSAGMLLFDGTGVSFMTTGAYYGTGYITRHLCMHDYGGYVDGWIKRINYTAQCSVDGYFNGLRASGMPDVVGFGLHTAGRTITGGTAKVYAR